MNAAQRALSEARADLAAYQALPYNHQDSRTLRDLERNVEFIKGVYAITEEG